MSNYVNVEVQSRNELPQSTGGGDIGFTCVGRSDGTSQ